MTNLNEKEMELLRAVIMYALDDMHKKICSYYVDDMFYDIVEDLGNYEVMLRLMDEFKNDGDALNYLDDANYLPMGAFKGYIKDDVDELVKEVAEDFDLEEYAEGVIKFLKSPQIV